jgi:hypothetical protein
MVKSRPEVFIIESLDIEDEKNKLFEGRIISQVLHLSGKRSIYYYIRTKAEFKIILEEFKKSSYRYLHLSCHANKNAMYTTIDRIDFAELGRLLCPVLGNRRLFLSACSMANNNLAQLILPKSKCYSIVGPTLKVAFNDAAILLASFYHLMFKANATSMKRTELIVNVEKLAYLFNVPINCFSRDEKSASGYSSKIVKPIRETN